MHKLLSDDDIEPIRSLFWEGVDRLKILELYSIKEWTLSRFIKNHLRDHSPPGGKPWLDGYVVYNDGRVWSKKLYGWLKPYTDQDGYLTLGQDLVDTKVHRLVLRMFSREPESEEVSRHLDGNPSNNHIENLMWGTTQQNQFDRVKMGRHHLFSNFNKRATLFSKKTYGHEQGLSACFRQWRAQSHCSKYHGYALKFTFEFGCVEPDQNGWVMDFGGLKPVKKWLQDIFDHKLIVASTDPLLEEALKLEEVGVADIVLVEEVGCEAFARMAFFAAEKYLFESGYSPRVWIQSVQAEEHAGNGVKYEPYRQ